MSTLTMLHEIVEAADALPEEDQEELIASLRRRDQARSREQFLRECDEAEAEHAAGLSRVVSVDEMMRNITS